MNTEKKQYINVYLTNAKLEHHSCCH